MGCLRIREVVIRSAAENVFIGHWVQAALFCVAENEPAAHWVQACVAVTDEPAAHVLSVGVHASVSPAPDVSDVVLHAHVVGAFTLAPAVEFVSAGHATQWLAVTLK